MPQRLNVRSCKRMGACDAGANQRTQIRADVGGA